MEGADTSKMSRLQGKVEEVKGIVHQNIESVLARGENIGHLQGKVEDLNFEAQEFNRQGKKLRWQMKCQMYRMYLIIAAVVVVLAIIIFVIACYGGGSDCTASRSTRS